MWFESIGSSGLSHGYPCTRTINESKCNIIHPNSYEAAFVCHQMDVVVSFSQGIIFRGYGM